ncbi:nucleoid occlusion factor SlmA [Pelagibaculum spongiae]|uniref:Nucleoid occlusion factor SlmA n=1 Tax=Pelagibaculum spongiae TaxID=2080658 RepID=A0A2V1GVF4_9GAMM|nr:nucleoid occlusion factor SlmA [Pelagibaculum spongiae]PVZ67647.1 nucleoid occlusion factor SlmA [Pelagibaculum spongiae]
MSSGSTGNNRKEQILQALAHMLEKNSKAKITTAALAKEVGVSEAALYRHFPSKARMFEGLIDYVEQTIFERIGRIVEQEKACRIRTYQLLTLVLGFAGKNPGLCRILTGSALQGENERLHQRVVKFYERLETQLKQILREAELREQLQAVMPVTEAAALLLAVVEGRLQQYVRSDFERKPLDNWDLQAEFLIGPLLISSEKS